MDNLNIFRILLFAGSKFSESLTLSLKLALAKLDPLPIFLVKGHTDDLYSYL